MSYGGILLVVMLLVACVCVALVVARFRSLASQTAEEVRSRWLAEEAAAQDKLDRLAALSESPETRSSLAEGEGSGLLMDFIRANRGRLGLDLLAAVGADQDWGFGQIGTPEEGEELPFKVSDFTLPDLTPEETSTFLISHEVKGKRELLLCRMFVVTRWSGGPAAASLVGGVFLEDLLKGTGAPAGSRLVLRPTMEDPIALGQTSSNEGTFSYPGRWLRPLFTLSIREVFDPGDGPLGNLEISVTDEYALGTAVELLGALLLLFISSTAVACLAAVYLAKSITEPIDQLSRAARDLSSGLEVRQSDLTRWNLDRGDEIGLLMRSFQEMAEQIKEQHEQRLRAERLAAWREMARRVAHEIKNPLTPIQLSVENLRRNTPEGTEDAFRELVGQCCQTVLEEVGRLRRYVDEFSKFAKMPKPALQACDLGEAVQSTVRTYTTGVQGIELNLDVPEQIVEIQADRQQVEMALANLLKNALEAMPSGGSLDVRLWTDNGGAFIRVADSGVGMSEEMLRTLFEPYVTTKDTGTGLGMAMVQNVVSEHRGKVEVHSTLGEGTQVTVVLPLTSEEEEDFGKP